MCGKLYLETLLIYAKTNSLLIIQADAYIFYMIKIFVIIPNGNQIRRHSMHKNINLTLIFFFRLCINCDNAQYGCTRILKLDTLAAHLEECEHNPKRPLPCEQGCGLIIPKDELKDHNCVKELRALIETQQQKLNEFQQDLTEQRFTINEQKRELQLLKVSTFD